jgi:hypothetical protein
MKFLKNIATTGLVAATAIGFSLLAQPQQAQAASIRLIPAGLNIDSDGIRDSVQVPGSAPDGTVNFGVVLDVLPGDLFAGEIVNTINFVLNWDPTELQGVTFSPAGAGSSALAAGASSFAATITGLNVNPAVTGQSLGSFAFNVLPGLNNDGVRDLWITNPATTNLADFTLGTPRFIEVQAAGNAIPTPALLPGLAAMGMGMLRRKKAQKVAA